MKITRKTVLTCLWACVATALFPVAFLYFTNIAEVSPSDSVSAVLFSLAAMAVLFLASLLILRNSWKASVVAGLFFLMSMNYDILEKLVRKLVPQARYWNIIPVCVVTMLHVVYFLCKKLSPDFFETATTVLGLVFSALILINVLTAVPTMIEKGRVQAQQAADLAAQDQAGETTVDPEKAGDHPNIYYLIFDEYSNFPVLEKFYQYENAEFRDFLEKNHFAISLDSHNESWSTSIITTNYLNLKYVATSKLDYEPYRKDPELFQLLDSYGYDIHFMSEDDPIGWKDAAAEKQAATTADGLKLWDLLFQRTILYPFATPDTGDARQEKFYREFDFLNDSVKLSDHNSFVYLHCIFPHAPYVFTADGKYVGMENTVNTEDGQYYLGQLIYTTKYMMDSLEQILEQDPDSIIIVQSDHSNRYIGAKPGQGTTTSWENATNILNAVYYRGEDISEIKGHSGVNTVRAVLNRALGTDFEMLEVPRYDQ